MEKKEIINVYVLSFLIVSIICLGGLNFFINKDLIDNFLNYYIIFATTIAGIILFINNIENFKWQNIKKVPLFFSLITLFWFGLTCGLGISFNMATIKGFINFACILAIMNILININFSKNAKNKIINTILWAFFITCILGIIQYLTGVNLITYSNYLYPGILGRINSTFYIATLYDKFILLIMPLIFYNLLTDKNKYLNNLLLIFSGIAMILTFSRSGLIIYFSLLALYFIIFIFKKKFLSLITIIVTFILMLIIPGATYAIQSGIDFVYEVIKTPTKFQIDLVDLNPILNNFYNIFNSKEEKVKEDIPAPEENKKEEKEKKPSESNRSIITRKLYKQMGKNLIKEYPIFGIGVGNYSYLYQNQNFKDYLKDQSIFEQRSKFMYPHNGFIHLTAEVGYIGLILLIATIFSFLYPLKFKDKKWELFTSFVILYCMFFSGYTESIFHSKQYTFITLIIFAFLAAYLQSQEKVKISKKKNKVKK